MSTNYTNRFFSDELASLITRDAQHALRKLVAALEAAGIQITSAARAAVSPAYLAPLALPVSTWEIVEDVETIMMMDDLAELFFGATPHGTDAPPTA